jgi:tetratricopeptide (TPR) repeat protein
MEEDDSVKRFVAWLATAATLTFALPGMASQNDPRLDALFAKLKSTPDVAEAQAIEQLIWRVWLVSGDDKIDAVMAAGVRALAFNDHAAALGAFDEVVRLAPGFAEGWNKRATVHYLLGGYDASAADIARTLELEPRHFGALSGLGLVRLAQGKEAEALDAFEAALKVHPHLPGADTHIKQLRERIKGKRI